MINTEVFIGINELAWEKALPEYQELSSHVVSLAVNFINNREPLDFFNSKKTLLFNLCLSNDQEIHALNKEFRGYDKPTNVLSFANIDDPDFEKSLNTNDEIEMGDIIIALETLQKESQEKKISLHDHFCHLLTHGVLHLLGYDHIEDDEAEHMEAFEIEILNLLNIPNPYQE